MLIPCVPTPIHDGIHHRHCQVSRVNVEELAALGEAWAERHRQLERATPAKGMSPHLKALSQVFRQRDTSVDEKEVIEDRVEVRCIAESFFHMTYDVIIPASIRIN